MSEMVCIQIYRAYLSASSPFIVTMILFRSFLRKFQFDYLVVDEGHTLKVSCDSS